MKEPPGVSSFTPHDLPLNTISPWFAELIGTALLVLFGNGVVANAVLSQTKGFQAGWLAITAGWGLGVMMAVYAVGTISGAHLNPAVTLGLAAIGRFPSGEITGYLLAQFTGGFVGAALVWLIYYPHWKITPEPVTKRAAFCTYPQIRHSMSNFFSEAVGTAMLMFGILAIPSANNLPAGGWATGFGPLLVGLLVMAIGLSLGGPTGYAINPARDLGPRLAHAVLPVAGKGDSDWGYAWIPVLGPIAGGLCGAWFYDWIFTG